jgi:protein-disulfide isomerase
MFKRLIMSTALCSGVFAGSAMAQSADISDERWGEIRVFLEENPALAEQVEDLMALPSVSEQVAMDAESVKENYFELFEDTAIPFIGNPEGDIVLVKFSDYSCTHCRAMNATLEALMEDNDRIQVRMMEYPILSNRSVDAAKYALAVNIVGGPEAYASVHDQLFEAPSSLTDEIFEQMSKDLGLDYEAISAEMKGDTVNDQIKKSREVAENLRITGTPGIIIGDIIVRGQIPLEAMKQGIEEIFPSE